MSSKVAAQSLRFSVIIPTFNEERFVGRCLASLARQTVPRDQFEIIVVDNGSTDGTLAICQASADRLLNYPGLRVGALRNRGASVASGAVLAFLDADCEASSEWLRNAEIVLAAEPCVTGDSYRIPPDPHWIERAWFAQEHRGRRHTQLIPAGNMLVHKSTFWQLGGFNESAVAGEDAEFCQRAARLIPVIADERLGVVHLGNPKTLKRFLEREAWHGMGAFESLRQDWKDKPLIATLCFAILTLGQILGLLASWTTGGRTLLAISTVGVIALLAATVIYRLRETGAWAAAASLLVLYYAYFLGRTLSLGRLLLRHEFGHRTK